MLRHNHIPFRSEPTGNLYETNCRYLFPITHLSVSILQLLTFILKVLFVCGVQAVIRWTLPRFRYDQLMKLGWRTLLPLSLANIVVTAIVVLALQQSSGALDILRTVGDITQAIVAASMIAGVIALILWALKPNKRQRLILSSSAEMAAEKGGTRATPMQA